MARQIFSTVALVAAAVMAIPFKRAACDVSDVGLVLPPGQTALSEPTSAPVDIVLGVGYQNYTCNDAGSFVAAGALAELYDLSCAVGSAAFDNSQDDCMTTWLALPDDISALSGPFNGFAHYGTHFFKPSPSGSGISPVWDTRAVSTPGDFFLGAKIAGLAAPTGSQDVDWLEVGNVEGGLAKKVYRTDTRGGPATGSCTAGQTLEVKYCTKYWLY